MKSAEGQTPPASLEKLLLDKVHGKYKLVLLAIRWAYEIQKREEFKGKPFSVVVDVALAELLTGDVKLAEVEKLPPLKKGEIPTEANHAAPIPAPSEDGNHRSKKEKK